MIKGEKMKPHDYEKYASEYAELGMDGEHYLILRDVPACLQKYVNGKKALDYGCGSGRSTRFVKTLGFDTVGVDISQDMLKQARVKDTSGVYQQIHSGQLPFEDETFDLIYSSYVLVEIATLAKIETVLREMKRVLKQDGFLLIITPYPERHKGDFITSSFDFPENK